jgi:hypothetical protein
VIGHDRDNIATAIHTLVRADRPAQPARPAG